MYWLRQNGCGDMKSEGHQKKTEDRIPESKGRIKKIKVSDKEAP